LDRTFEAFLTSWPLDPWIVVPLILTAFVYLRGWLELRARSRRFNRRHLGTFLAGLVAIFLALASPIEPFVGLLLQVHMVQHLLLMIVAPPLLWLGAPLLPLLRGLPAPMRGHWIAPLFRAPALRALFGYLLRPAVSWVVFVAATWIWHVPELYETALRSPGWHVVEHACFLGSGLLFWFPVIQPYPSRPRFSRWLLLPYLFLADVQNTALSALFTFSGRVLYSTYEAAPRLWNVAALDDQKVAGLLMWVPGSFVFLVPLVVIARGLLYGERKTPKPEGVPQAPRQRALGIQRLSLPLVSPTPRNTDVLRWPLLGRFLHWRHARLALQLPLFALALLIIIDGLCGPQIAPLNLAGVLPWIHWRGLVVLGLLVAGNVFCMACPFMLPRRLARRWLPAQRYWPRALRSKWLGVALLVLFFWAYEAFSLWDSPWWTAWIAIGYFVAAFAVDGLFRGAAFCKYVCPIGQFHFVNALVAPIEVRVRDVNQCLSCETKDCIRGNAEIPGCELGLFVPRKVGNMDCTFCLDCVHACPHDNIGLIATLPGAALLHDPHRSGVGRFSRRRDLAGLVLVLVAAAFAGAAAMVAPVVTAADRLASLLHLETKTVTGVGVVLFMLLTLVPLLWRHVSNLSATRFALTLIPLGLGMWLAHFSFHFFTGIDAFIPALQRAAADLGTSVLGEPNWRCCCAAATTAGLLRLEIIFLDLGLLLSLYLGYRTGLELAGQPARAVRMFAPWGALMILLFALGIWVLFQPMEMRGMMPGG
jgi:cytochrome c oxidase assembly factor CtaG/ferredoxin